MNENSLFAESAVQPTSMSLLDLLQQDEEDDDAWKRMLKIYQPLIEKWLIRFGAPTNDLNDLSQNILTVVVRKLPGSNTLDERELFEAGSETLPETVCWNFGEPKKYSR